MESTLYHAFAPGELLDIVIRHGLHFDQALQTGVLLNILASVGGNGWFGVVAVGDSPTQAEELYDRIQLVLMMTARRMTPTANVC